MINNIARNATIVAGHLVGRAMGIQYGPSIVNWGISRCVSGYVPQFLCRIAVHGAIDSSLGYANIGAAIFMLAASVMPSPRTIHEHTTQPALNQLTNYNRNSTYQQLCCADDAQDQTTKTPTTLASAVFGAFQLDDYDAETIIIEKGDSESMDKPFDDAGSVSVHPDETVEGFTCVDTCPYKDELQTMRQEERDYNAKYGIING